MKYYHDILENLLSFGEKHPLIVQPVSSGPSVSYGPSGSKEDMFDKKLEDAFDKKLRKNLASPWVKISPEKQSRLLWISPQDIQNMGGTEEAQRTFSDVYRPEGFYWLEERDKS